MLMDNISQRLIGKSLLVITEKRWRVDARQDSRLPRSALRSAFDAKPRIRAHEQSVMDKLRLFILKDGERRDLVPEHIQGIKWPTRADSQSVNEEKKYRHWSR